MAARVWGSSEDGTIEYVSLTKETLQQGLEVMRESFFVDEMVSRAVELHKHPAARRELEELSMNAARDGVSVIAVEKATGRVVGVAFNKLQVKTEKQESYFENYRDRCTEPSSKALIQFMIDTDASYDLFEHLKINSFLEIMFLAISPDFRKRGIALRLCTESINLAKKLKNGENVKTSIDDRKLDLEPAPKAVSAIFTSFISQKLGKTLGFKEAIAISYEKFEFQGKTYASQIGPQTPFTTLEYLLL